MLDEQQVSRYERDGFIVLHDVFADSEVAQLRDAVREDARASGPHRIMEDDGVAVRAIYASHTRHPVFHSLVRQDRLLGPVRQLLAAEVYVYQLKVNAKNAFVGAAWAWHQDYVVWRHADNLPRPAAVNVAVLLDDITEFNGPLIFLAGSHALGDVEPARNARDNGPSDDHIDPAAFTLDAARISAIAAERPMTSPKARAGAVILFHPQVVHASGQNMSPFSRNIAIITYNDVANVPRRNDPPRPEYLVGRDSTPLTAVGDLRAPTDRS